MYQSTASLLLPQDDIAHVEALEPLRLTRSALFEGHALTVLQALCPVNRCAA